jgi:hypothetical protein
MCCTTARADPFAVRNPVPDAPPSKTSTIDPFATAPEVELLDPGYSRRRTAAVLAVGGGVLWGASFVLSRTMYARYNAALDRRDAGDDPYQATDDANRAQHIAKVWGTTIFAAGGLAIGAGLLVYASAPPKIRREHVVVMPAIDRDGAGVAISGGF